MSPDRAKQLRLRQTDAERKLWSRLRNNLLGVKFRRQHQVDGYIVDFACIEKGLVVELDGGQHLEQQGYDTQRTATLASHGLRVFRFWNDDVLERIDDVLNEILRKLEASPPHPHPLPPLRRGRGSRPSQATGAAMETGRTTEAMLPHPIQTAAVRREWRSRESAVLGSGKGEWRPTADLAALRMRARLYALVRGFFAARDVLEVETPVLSRAANTDPNIESFELLYSGTGPAQERMRYLRTSPEFALKRLLSGGVGDCYELGRVFRNGEAGRRHNPEFTMLEWYRIGWDHHRLMDEVAELIRAALALAGREVGCRKLTYRQLFQEFASIDPFVASDETLREALSEFDIRAPGLDRDDWLNLLLTHRIEPQLRDDMLLLVHDFPASQAALARVRDETPPVAERFEAMLGRTELANGYHELLDPSAQRERFEADNRKRLARNQLAVPVDENLLQAMEHGLPACAGVAMGIDRLLMLMLGSLDLSGVIAVPFDRA